MERKIYVLQSVNSLGIGGNPIFVMNYYRKLNKEKFQVDFIIYNDTKMDFYKEVVSAGSKVHICKTKHKNKLVQLLSHMHQVKKILKNNHYDIIHCNSCSFFGIFRGAIPGFFTKGTKVIAHSHNAGAPKNTLIDNSLHSLLKIILCHIIDYGFTCSDVAGESKYTKKFMNSSKYVIIHNAVEVEKFLYDVNKRHQIRKKFDLENEIVIGNVGRLSQQKNQKYLLEIMNYLLKNSRNVALLIVGGGELEEALKSQAEEFGISEHVYFTGMVNNANEYYSAMDVFVMPSLYEGLPFTAVEAQVNGLKCVMSDAVTPMSNISGDVEFVSLDNPIEIWANIIWKQAQQRSSKEKVENVLKEYDLTNETKKLEQYYIRILEGNEI